MPFTRIRRLTIWLPLLLIVVVWVLLYLPHLRNSPGWYGDETLTLINGQSLVAGQATDRAFKTTYWHPSFPYQPGYTWFVGLVSQIFGGDIWGGRLVNAVLALAIALLVGLRGQRTFGVFPALFAALLFLTYDQSVIHFRWIYPHNSVALGFAIAALALLKKSSPRADWTAGAGLALSALSHPLFIHGAFATWLCRIKRPQSWLRLALPPAAVLVGSLGLTFWLSGFSDWLGKDMGTLLEFYRSFSRENGSSGQAVQNIFIFFTHDGFHLISALAILLCCRKKYYPIAIFSGTVSFLLLQNRQNLPLFYYQAVVFLPVLALAWAGALATLTRFLRRRAPSASLHRIIPRLVLILPLVWLISQFPAVAEGRLVPRNHIWVTQRPAETEAAAQWVNQHSRKDDLVICHQNIGWLLHSQTADLLQATSWEGRETFGFPQPLPAERLVYSPDLSRAKFLVIADIDARWTIHQPNVMPLIERVQNEKWPTVWAGEFYMVLQNPNYTDSPAKGEN